MIEIQYSTGQASGITRIPIRTMQDYVKSFREFFSEEARQPSKGRRFTDPDIDKLLTIQRLRAERFPDEDIRKVLAGEVPLKLAHQYNEAEIKKMAANALENYESAVETFETCQKMIVEVRSSLAQVEEENRQLHADNKAWKARVNKLHEWQLYVMKNFPELNPYDQESKPEPITQEKPKGLFGGLFG